MNTKQLKQKILSLAIQGKLVPQDSNDEPASVLLDMIRKEKERLIREGKLKKDKHESIIYRGKDNKFYEQYRKAIKCIEDDIPFEIPNEWVWCRMGNIGDWGAGSTPSKGTPSYYGGDILWLTTGELNNGIVYDTKTKITEKALKECSLRINKVGDILIAMYGATIGKLAIVGKEMTTNQACCACTPYFIYNYYLFYFLMASKNDFINKGEGGAQPNISREKLIHHLIPIPPLAEQHRIVEKVESLFTLIDTIEKDKESIKENINATRQKLLTMAIRGELVPQDPNDEPAIELLKRINSNIRPIVEDVPYEIPKGWCWVKLGELAHYKKGPFGSSLTKSMFVPKGNDTYKVYEQKNAIQKNEALGNYFITKEKYESLIGFSVQPYDIIVSCAGTIGETYVLSASPTKGIINQALMLIRLRNRSIESFYLLYFDFILKQESCKKGKGVAIKNIPPFSILKNFLIPIPPLAEQKRIVEKLSLLSAQLDDLEKNA